jgi:hypothetical protein
LAAWFNKVAARTAIALLVVAAGACDGDPGVCRGAIALSAFADTAGVLKPDGSLWTWTQYQGAMRPQVQSNVPRATEFANGQMCLRLANGDVTCPSLLVGPLPEHAREVSVWFEGGLGIDSSGRVGVCALLADGTASCALAVPLEPIAFASVGGTMTNVSAGQDHYCAITTGGSLTCQPWQATTVPGSVNDPGLATWSGAGATLSNLVEVVTASNYSGDTLVRTADGDLWRLHEQDPDVVVEQVQGIGGPVSRIIAGPSYFCALRTDGAVFCWHDDDLEPVTHAKGDQPPEQITSLPKPATALAGGPGLGGGEFACALLEDTTVWCWGAGFGGFAGQRVAACD